MDNYELFQEFLQLDRQIDEFYHNLAQSLGLSDSALWVLWSLVEQGEGCTQRDICRKIALTKQTVHSSVRKLEKDGCLSLRPSAGREVAIFLTERGRELVREKVLPAMEAERTAAGGLSAEELREMIRLSRKWFSLFQAAASGLVKA